MRSPSTAGRLCGVRAEQITQPLANHGEGPCWLAGSGEVAWVDMLAGRVLVTTPDTGATRAIAVPSRVAAIVRPRIAGGLVVVTETGVLLLDEAEAMTGLCEIIDDSSIRLNEGGCDPQGRLWCGTMAWDAREAAGTLYRVEADGSFAAMLAGVTISNGLGWTADGATAYYVDSMAGIDRFAFDGATGELSDRRRFADVGEGVAIPDGLAVDAEGGVWVALWDGGEVRRYTPDGSVDAIVPLPCGRVTACSFGGDDLDELFITTSRLDLPDGVDPQGGALFRCEPGVRGQAVHAFAG